MRQWLRVCVVACVVVCACASLAHAQNCRKVYTSRQNARVDYVVSTTAVQVLAPNTSRCGAIIYNTSVSDMRCTHFEADGAPTPTAGFLVKAGSWWTLDLEGQGTFQCISTSGTNAAASVAESLP